MADAIKKFLEEAPLEQAIEMIENGVISYEEVNRYCGTPISRTSSAELRKIPAWILGQTLGGTGEKFPKNPRQGSIL